MGIRRLRDYLGYENYVVFCPDRDSFGDSFAGAIAQIGHAKTVSIGAGLPTGGSAGHYCELMSNPTRGQSSGDARVDSVAFYPAPASKLASKVMRANRRKETCALCQNPRASARNSSCLWASPGFRETPSHEAYPAGTRSLRINGREEPLGAETCRRSRSRARRSLGNGSYVRAVRSPDQRVFEAKERSRFRIPRTPLRQSLLSGFHAGPAGISLTAAISA